MRLLICGSRDWTDFQMIYRRLRELVSTHYGQITVVHGGARGADLLAGAAARSLGIAEDPNPVDSRLDGPWPMAGHRRNMRMLRLGADKVWGFKDGFDWTFTRGGTENMIKIAHDAGVETEVFGHD